MILTAICVFGIGWFIWRGIVHYVKQPGINKEACIALGVLTCPLAAYLATLIISVPPHLGQVVLTIHALAYAFGAKVAVPRPPSQ